LYIELGVQKDLIDYYRKEYQWRTKEDLWNPLTAYLIETRARLTSFAYGHVLDIGCGDGYISVRMLDHGLRVYGVDLGLQLLQEAEERGIIGVLCDAQKLCFKSEAFDTVILLETLEHLYSPEECLKEIHYVLKEKGRLVLSVPAKYGILVQILEFKSKIRKKAAPIHRLYGLREINGLLARCGFTVIRSGYFAMFNNIYVIARKSLLPFDKLSEKRKKN